MTNIDILNENKSENCKMTKKTKMKKKLIMKRNKKNDISNVKFVNMTNMKLFKYASLFINKTFNNFL
jgi:hypothetical protein